MALNVLIVCCRAKQKAAESAARKAAKGARRPAAAVATSAPHAAPGPSSANGRPPLHLPSLPVPLLVLGTRVAMVAAHALASVAMTMAEGVAMVMMQPQSS